MTGDFSGAGAASTPPKIWFPYWYPKPEAQLRLFCFPFAGGTASVFHRWADPGPSVEMLSIQYPGRETRFREPPCHRLRTLVDSLGPVILPLLDRPYAFFGYSLGALLSFELARWLRRAGAPAPLGLMLAAGMPPGRPWRRITHTLSQEDFTAELHRYAGTPPEVLAHPELLEMLLPMLRADFEMVETHIVTPEPPLSVPFAVWGGAEDEQPSPQALEGWRDYTSSDFMLQLFPGGHFFLQSSSNILREALVRTMARWFTR
jgi:medium-chain acyl-[acyl-carrier-protein] hydrolase